MKLKKYMRVQSVHNGRNTEDQMFPKAFLLQTDHKSLKKQHTILGQVISNKFRPLAFEQFSLRKWVFV